ncbi:MAG: hypothetical protein HQM10_20920 [Candidatus Riflebacteria bacterium]|nr:hypothetical protein [Candidatus Riflebacteria bacterium]
MRRHKNRVSMKGFTIVELSVVTLIFILLVYCVINLLIYTSHVFGKQEDSSVCSSEAAMIIGRIRADFEKAMTDGDMRYPFDTAKKSVVFENDKLSFKILSGTSFSDITYTFNQSGHYIQRVCNGESYILSRGMLASFTAIHQILCEDEKIRSYPDDPGSTAAQPPEIASDSRVIRSWVKVYLTLEGLRKVDGKAVVVQKYVFRVFPVRLNRQWQSIWKNDTF